MSEFQYHEWQTVDRVLSAEEQAAVRGLSSHIEVSASRAIVTYHWSSFRHDPKQVLLNYFDAYLYLANWGSLRLMFRFPTGLLEETDIAEIKEGFERAESELPRTREEYERLASELEDTWVV
jgi:hypothetical protein